MASALRYFALLYLACLAGFCPPARAAAPIPEDGHSAVIMVYHRVGEDAQPDSNISLEQFLSHVEEINAGHYNVMPLPDLIAALKRNDILPPRTIAITFDGAFRSVMDNALPVLVENNIPFTVFYSADFADAASGPYMDWSDLQSLAEHEGVTLGLLPSSYARLKDSPEDEIRRQVNKARARHRETIGGEAQFFSYPFGEYSPAYKKIIEGAGFVAAFGQQSGAVAGSSDFFALPRFTMTDQYGDTERFRTVAEALPFPVHDVEPQGTELATIEPAIGFSVPGYLAPGLKSMSCFVSGQPDPEIVILNERAELRLKEPVNDDRVRVNCTIPGPTDPLNDTPAWRWFGMLLVNGEETGPETQPSSSQPPLP